MKWKRSGEVNKVRCCMRCLHGSRPRVVLYADRVVPGCLERKCCILRGRVHDPGCLESQQRSSGPDPLSRGGGPQYNICMYVKRITGRSSRGVGLHRFQIAKPHWLDGEEAATSQHTRIQTIVNVDPIRFSIWT